MIMIMKAHTSSALLICTLFSVDAYAETTPAQIPVGMADDTCAGLPVQMSPALQAWRVSTYADEDRTTSVALPPADEISSFRQAQAEAAKRDWADLCRYRIDNVRLTKAPAEMRQIVFMGDSITQSWELAHPGFFKPGMINRGISGQTTPQMLLRFQADVIALRPRVVHIMAGTNDVAGNTGVSSADMYRSNIIAMVQLAKTNHVVVILAAIPPAKSFPWRPQLKPVARIRTLNAWLKSYAIRKKLTFVDYTEALAQPDGAMKAALTLDGVHPNGAGYTKIESLTRDAMRRAGLR